MSDLIPGLSLSALWPRPKTVALTQQQIDQAKQGVDKMATLTDALGDVLNEHEQAIKAVEGFMAEHAKRAEGATDPLLVQAAISRVKEHTNRLLSLLTQYPLVK